LSEVENRFTALNQR